MYGSHCCKYIVVSDIQYYKKHNDIVYPIYWRYICSDNVQKAVIAIASPFSLFKGSNILKSLYELDLLGNFELRINVCIVIQVIFEVLLICISYYRYKHSSNRKESVR